MRATEAGDPNMLYLTHGDDRTLVHDFGGVPEDQTITVATMTLKAAPLDTTAVLTKTVTAESAAGIGEITNTGTNTDEDRICVVEFEFTALDTASLGLRTYAYDIQVTTSEGKIYTTEKGSLSVTYEVTT